MLWNRKRNKKDIFEKQISAINIWTTIMGLTFLLVFGGIGYLQFKSAGEISSTLQEMKKDMKDYSDTYKQELSQNISRIDNLETRMQYQIDREIRDMKEKVDKTVGDLPEPANVVLLVNGLKIQDKLYSIKTENGPDNLRSLIFPSITILNDGGRPTGELMIYCTTYYITNTMNSYSDMYPRGNWDRTKYNYEEQEKTDWIFNIDSDNSRYINPGESWTINIPEGFAKKETKEVKFLIEVFYGSKVSSKSDLRFSIE